MATNSAGRHLSIVDFLDTSTPPRTVPRTQADEGVTALYAAQGVSLIRMAFVILGDRGAAEDVVQDAFVGLYRNWDRLDDRTFAVSVLTYLTASVHGSDSFAKVTETASWYVVQLAPGTATPARLTLLPVKPQALHGDAGLITANAAISRSGSALAMTTLTASGGLAVQVFSVATGQLLRDWTSSVSPDVQPGLTWIDRDRDLAVETPSFDAAGMTETVRELSVSGPASGDLLADGKVVDWDVQLGPNTQSLLETCTASPGLLSRHDHLISADGTAFGCAAMTGPDTDPILSFLTYPLPPGTAVTAKARVDYQVTIGAKKQVAYAQILWISPSGGTVVGQWATLAKGAERVAPNGLHFGAMSHGKFTPLRFPPGFSSPTIAF
jgi:hypothetical protein